MLRLFFVFLSVVVLGCAIVGAAAVGGYYAHKLHIEPIYSLAERADTKLRREFGLPTKTVGLVDTINSGYLRLRGRTYLIPNQTFQTGGALALWEDDVLVMHADGRIFYLDEAQGQLVQADVTLPDNGREGYADLAASPKYAGRPTRIGAHRYNDLEFIDEPERRGLLLSYTFVDVANECYRSRVSWVPVPQSVASVRDVSLTASDWDLVFETSPCLPFNETGELMVGYMAGGRMAYKSPNLLYLGSGEYHRDGIYRPDAGIQDDASDYGKTIEINLDTGEARHFSKGHRNLQGVTLDTQGRLWTTEHGMRGGDELNLISDGENYGWPLENLGTLYSGVPAPSASGVGRHDLYRAPVYAWLPSAAVSSIALIDGFHEAWDGDLLIGSLKEGTLFRARIQGERLVFLERIVVGERIRDVMQVGNNRLALWLDTEELVVFEIEERADPLEGLEEGLIAANMDPDLATSVKQTLTGCAECHSFEENIHGAGPSLFKLYGRPVASTTFANYSSALSSLGGTWDRQLLTAYLIDPATIAEGTRMTGLGLGNRPLAEGVAKGFEWLSGDDPS